MREESELDLRSEIKVSDANIAPFQLGEERRLVVYAFGIAVGGTCTFNFWQNVAKRGSSL
jgi:hypothetical protein